MKINRNTKMIVKSGSLVTAWDKDLGDRVVGKDYPVTVVEHYIDGAINMIYWTGRHGHYCGTDINNVRIAV